MSSIDNDKLLNDIYDIDNTRNFTPSAYGLIISVTPKSSKTSTETDFILKTALVEPENKTITDEEANVYVNCINKEIQCYLDLEKIYNNDLSTVNILNIIEYGKWRANNQKNYPAFILEKGKI